MNTKINLGIASVVLLALTQPIYADESQKPVTEQLVNTLTKLSGGHHKGFRSNHAKGIMVNGSFLASPEAVTISKAAHLQNPNSLLPVLVRFSNATGVPDIADGDANAHPKGLAIRINLPDGGQTDIVAISVNAFPSATPEDFLGLLNAVAETKKDTPNPTPIETFLGSHPAALKFVQMPKPAPASFASQAFFGVNAFEFTNAKNEVNFGRYRIIPEAQDKPLTDAEAGAKPANYLIDELPTRLKVKPAKFKLLLQVAENGDVINDATVVWPESRQLLELGTFTLETVIENSIVAEKSIMFNPLMLPEGIAPTQDPVLLARPGAYAVSFGRRLGN
jgi:catalase